MTVALWLGLGSKTTSFKQANPDQVEICAERVCISRAAMILGSNYLTLSNASQVIYSDVEFMCNKNPKT